MDSDTYIRMNGKAFHAYGYLVRPDWSPMTPNDRGRAMQRRGAGLREPKKMTWVTCSKCNTAHQHKECPWCGNADD